jgi:hypothetical protein
MARISKDLSSQSPENIDNFYKKIETSSPMKLEFKGLRLQKAK